MGSWLLLERCGEQGLLLLARNPVRGLLEKALRSLKMVHQFEDLLAREHILLLLHQHRLWGYCLLKVKVWIGLRGVGCLLWCHSHRSRRRCVPCWFHMILC